MGMDYKSLIRTIPDFPKAGIQFKDITPLLQNRTAYKKAIGELAKHFAHRPVDLIVSPEARGFLIGVPLAHVLGAGFVPVRKPGKLPYQTLSEEYDLEYGKDRLEIHRDAVQPGQNVLIADDLLATGGTILAVAKLVKQLGGHVIGAAFLIELEYLNGRNKIPDIQIYSFLKYGKEG
jgi:adenine phosphoribosyltransferase